jgi:hypothetical protein
LTFYLF